MQKALLALFMGLVVSLPASAEILYRTIDARGHVSFTDDPSRGGEPVELAPISVVPALPPVPSLTSATPSRDGAGTPSRTYETFAIASPEHETTLPTGAAGDVRVHLELRPALREGHRLRVLLDGEVARPASREPVIDLTNLARGEHRLRAELLDGRGQVLRRTPAVTLHVQRASVKLPQNPHHPDSRGQADR